MIFKSVPRTLPLSTRRSAGVAERSASPLGVPRFLRGNTSDARPAHAAVTMATRLAAHEMVSHRPVALSSQPLQIARQTVAKTSGEVVEWWPARQDPQWNPQYEERYRKTRPKDDTAQKDFDAERASGKVKAASSHGGTKVSTRLSADQVHRIVMAGGEKAAAERCAAMAGNISAAFETMLIDTAQAQADYLAHMAGESGGVLEEVGGEKRSYAPFQGRGPIQVTHPENYARALGTLQQRRYQIEAQIQTQATNIAILMSERDKATDATQKQEVIARIDAAHAAVDVFRLQMMQLDDTIGAVSADPKAAADPKHAFLISAALMHKTGATIATGKLGASAPFVGNGPADTWVSGGNKGMTFDARKAENEAELAEINAQLASETDADKIKDLQGSAAARGRLIQDMVSAKSRGRKKAAVYAAGFAILTQENAVAKAPEPESDPYADTDAEESPAIQRKAAATAAPAAPAQPRSGGGHPLPAEPRARLERGLGVDLGEVQVHTDAPAANTARSLGARAFATGQNVYFAAGEYDPKSETGFRLLAHEVVHTLQQRRATTGAQDGVSQPGDASEREADVVGDALADGARAPIPVTAASAPLALKARTAADLSYPEKSDPWMLAIAQRNVRNPTPGWIGGSNSVTHADMLALGYTYRGRSGNWRRYHLPGTEPSMILNVLINPEVDPEAIDPDDPSSAKEGDAAALAEAKSTLREWQRLTRKTLPLYDRLRILRAAGKGDTAEYQRLVDEGNEWFDLAAEFEKDYHDDMPDWRDELADDPVALAELDALAMGDVESLRSWMDDFDENRERGDNQKADDKWKQAEEDLKKLLEELQNSPAEEPDTGEETAPGE